MINELYAQARRHIQRGDWESAERALRQVLTLRPDYGEAKADLGMVLVAMGRCPEALSILEGALACFSNSAGSQAVIYANLGVLHRDAGRLDQAEECYRNALARMPGSAVVWNNLGELCFLSGRVEEALTHLTTARQWEPRNLMAASNQAFMMQYRPGVDAQALKGALAAWHRDFGEPLKRTIRPHNNGRSAQRRLKVGYVSPDFREHCQALFTLPLLEHHDKDAVEVTCYSDGGKSDGVTERLRRCVDRWRETAALSHEDLAKMIRGDGVDVLVDLTMHMSGNRLLVFAQKPAPVQVSWLAYPGSTGLEAIDYRLSDPYLDPAGMDDNVYSEKTWRLPATFWCFDPREGGNVDVGPLPALSKGHVTFGCLNNFCKVNDGVLRLWANVLEAVPGSRLVMLADAGRHRERTWQRLEELGVPRPQVEFVGRLPRLEYLKSYQQIDISLETLPYNGHTTSLDSFFMGVPVVTLVGQTVVGRAGLSQAMNLGLPELVARNAEEYVAIVRRWAGDLGKLAELRAGLRERMKKSPLMDGGNFARGFEEALRGMWRQWCETGA